METVRLGFVGCGTHATHNLYPAIKYARASLEAVCDLNGELARRNATLFGGKSWHTSVDDMLSKTELDGIIIVGPPDLHYEAGMKALQAGIPVLVEKPTAPDLASAEKMVRAAREHKTILMTAFMKRHGLTYGKIREYVQNGSFIPNSCFMKYMHWPMGAEHLRGMLLGMCSHPVDLVLSFFGMPSRIQCTLGNGTQHWTTLAVNMSFSEGRIAQLMLGAQVRIQEHFEISGTLENKPSFFVVDNVMNMELHSQGQAGIDVLAPSLDAINPTFDMADIRIWRPDFGLPNMGQTRMFVQGFAGEVREFCNAIIDGREPWPSGDEALQTMRVLEYIAANPDGVTHIAPDGSATTA